MQLSKGAPMYIRMMEAELNRYAAGVAAGLQQGEAVAFAKESMLDEPPAEPGVIRHTRWDPDHGVYVYYRLCTAEGCEDGLVDSICRSCSGTGRSNFASMACGNCLGSGTDVYTCDECDGEGLVECMSDGGAF